MSYSNGFQASYEFPAVSVVTAAVIGRIYPPFAGATGRLVGVSHIVSTAVTVATGNINIGTAANADAFGVSGVPVSALNAGGNDLTQGVDNIIPEDAVVEISAGGESTAGAVNLHIIIEWS